MSQIARIFSAFDKVVRERLRQSEKEGKPVACRGRGCNWCCYDLSLISRAEARELLSAFSRLSAPLKARVLAQHSAWMRAHIGMEFSPLDDPKEIGKVVLRSMERDTPCAFLVDGACSVYSSRPLACRGHHSLASTPVDCLQKNLGTGGFYALDLSWAVLEAWNRMKGTQAEGIAELHEMVGRYGTKEGFSEKR